MNIWFIATLATRRQLHNLKKLATTPKAATTTKTTIKTSTESQRGSKATPTPNDNFMVHHTSKRHHQQTPDDPSN